MGIHVPKNDIRVNCIVVCVSRMTTIRIPSNGTGDGSAQAPPVIFVDASYYVFHRYFATLRWYGFRFMTGLTKEEYSGRVRCIHEDEDFVAAFFKHVCADIEKWRKTFKSVGGPIIFGMDCSRADIWRHALTPGYKQTRVQAEGFNGNIFVKFYTWFDENAEGLGLFKLRIDHMEADDVIALGVRSVLSDAQNTAQIVVITNDNDYLQLRKGGRVTLVNAQLADIAVRSSIGTPEQDLLAKILQGDSSDNIPSVAPKVGPKTAKDLAHKGRDAVILWATEKGCLDRFYENEALISFDKIPGDLVSAFHQTYKFEVTTPN